MDKSILLSDLRISIPSGLKTPTLITFCLKGEANESN